MRLNTIPILFNLIFLTPALAQDERLKPPVAELPKASLADVNMNADTVLLSFNTRIQEREEHERRRFDSG